MRHAAVEVDSRVAGVVDAVHHRLERVLADALSLAASQNLAVLWPAHLIVALVRTKGAVS